MENLEKSWDLKNIFKICSGLEKSWKLKIKPQKF